MARPQRAVCFLSVLLLALPAGLRAEEPAVPDVERARALCEAGEIQAAIDLLLTSIEGAPYDFPLRLELGRAGAALARRVGAENGPSAAALAWLDAVKWLEEALRLNPLDQEGLRLLAEAAEGAGEVEKAVDAWRRLLPLVPGDVGAWRRAGHALRIARRPAEAIAAFRIAEAADGPEPLSLLSRAEIHLAEGQPAEAMEAAARLFRLEADQDRPDSGSARRALNLLWSTGRAQGAFADLECIYAGWCARYPTLASPPYYLGHTYLARSRFLKAVGAFRLLTERSPRLAFGWRLLAGALVDATRPEEAPDAFAAAVSIEPDEAEDAGALDTIVRAIAGKGDVPAALAALDRFPGVAAGSMPLRTLRGDLLLRAGRSEEAARTYLALRADAPDDPRLGVRVQKAVARLLLAGAAPPDLAALRVRPADPPGGAAVLADFEESQVLVRTTRAADGRSQSGVFHLVRQRGQDRIAASLAILLLPEIDSRPYVAVRFDVNGPAGGRMRVGAKDRWDDYDLYLPMMNRFLHEQAVALTGEWQTVDLPLDGFLAPGDQGTVVHLTREGLRGLSFELRPRAGSDEVLAGEVAIDNIALVAADGTVRPLASFDSPAEEVIASFEGAAAPLQSVPRIGQTVEEFPADATTFVSPSLLGSEYDPSMARSGRGAIRVACSTRNTPEDDQPAAMRLDFLPPRDISAARTLVFFARGEAGGERLVVTLADEDDGTLGGPVAAAPRTLSEGRLVIGAFVLDREWKEFRVPLSGYPEVLLTALRSVRFVIGGDLNDKAARIYLDDVALE